MGYRHTGFNVMIALVFTALISTVIGITAWAAVTGNMSGWHTYYSVSSYGHSYGYGYSPYSTRYSYGCGCNHTVSHSITIRHSTSYTHSRHITSSFHHR